MRLVRASFVNVWPATWSAFWGVLESVDVQPARTVTPPDRRTLTAPTPKTLEAADG